MNPFGGAAGRWMLVAFAVVAGVSALVLQNKYLTTQRQALESERQKLAANVEKLIDVVVASKDLSKDAPLESSTLKMTSVPERFVQPYAVRAIRDVVGLVTVAPVAAGEQILSNKLRRPDEAPAGSTLSSLTPKGKRAVTIAVDTITGVGGFVRAGDVVDILWTARMAAPAGSSSQNGEQVVTLTLFQGVPVLAIGRELPGTKKQDGDKDKGEAAGQLTVTLALSPQETSFLLVAREQGRIQLSLRPRNDPGAQVAVAPADMNALLAAVLGAQGAAPAKTGHRVEVYKGLQRDVVVLPEEPEAPAR